MTPPEQQEPSPGAIRPAAATPDSPAIAAGSIARREAALPKLNLTHPSGARVEIYLQGAHVASWRQPDGGEVLFMSRESRLEPGVPIRGGIPLVFPQFSTRGPLPQHGFARTLPWELVRSGTDDAGAAFAQLRLTDSEETRELWPPPFLAEFLVTLDQRLSTTLRVTNTGDAPFTFTSALHTYYRVGDIRGVSVEGLAGSRFLGVVEGTEPVDVYEPLLRIQGETNGVHAGVADRLRVRDPSLDRTLVIEKEGFADAVVWNPWIERSQAMPDFGDDEYLTMLCVEPANIAQPTRLAPGQIWSGTQRIGIERSA
jgi:glucose-6-phosphate 1-epimerase